jgi:hypothetical protein
MSFKIKHWKKIGLSLLLVSGIFGFLTVQAADQSDAIAVRVMPNPSHDGIESWYAKQGYHGSPQSLIVDGYEAIRDGRTVFINAGNLDLANNKLYTNIYLISYNQNSEDKTADILGQLVSHWKFNSNMSTLGHCSISNVNCATDTDCPATYVCSNTANLANQGKCILKDDKVCLIDSDCPISLFCDSLKAKATRDVKRLGEFNLIKNGIDTYYSNNKKAYPSLTSGTYVEGASISLWPSWQSTFWPLLAIDQLFVDPINTLGYCAGYDLITCWNKDKNEFVNANLVLPYGSYAFIYTSAKNGNSYNLCTVFETKAAGYDTAEGQISSGSCAVGAGYGSAGANTAPIIKSSSLNGETGKEFNGFIEASDNEGDVISWELKDTTPSADWSGWSSTPVLIDSGNPNQKKIFAAKAGGIGTYKMLLNLKDSRGATSSAEIIININEVNKPKIEASDIDYFVDPVNRLTYTFYVQGTNATPSFTFKPVKAGDLDFSKFNPTISTTTLGLNRVKVDYSVLIPTTVSIPNNLSVQYRITALENTASTSKDVNINLKMEQPYLDFACENTARLGQGYQISNSTVPRSCLIGNIASGNHSLAYSVDGPTGLKIRYDASNAYLEANALTVTDIGKKYPVKVKVANEYGASAEKTFDLSVNTFCGDGLKQSNGQPNTEGRGGLNNNGVEQCDGVSGVQTSAISISPALQYGCTTELGTITPYPINDNQQCVFKAADAGGGFCGDGVCQFQILANGKPTPMENCWNCSQDCGTCLATVTSNADQEQIVYANGNRLYKEQDKAAIASSTITLLNNENVFGFWNHNLADDEYGLAFRIAIGPKPSAGNPNPVNFAEFNTKSAELKCIDSGQQSTVLSSDSYEPAVMEQSGVFNWTQIGYNNPNKVWAAPVVNAKKLAFDSAPYIWNKDTNISGGSDYCRLSFNYAPYNLINCQSDCKGKTCGSDGCGNSCGTCGVDQACADNFTCVCKPNCTNKCSGSDGCGGTCPNKCVTPETCGTAGACGVFCGNGKCDNFETSATCQIDCPCDQNPSGVYTAATYYYQSHCSKDYYDCPITNALSKTDKGDICWSGAWRSTQCGNLTKPTQICNNDACITGIDTTDSGKPKFCYGHYDSRLKICIFDSKSSQVLLNGSGMANYNVPNAFTPSGTMASWGVCYTKPICGDSICSSEYGETCSSCPSDCTCPVVTHCNNDSDCQNNQSCLGVIGQCDQATGSDNCYYSDEATCNQTSACIWHIASQGTCS